MKSPIFDHFDYKDVSFIWFNLTALAKKLCGMNRLDNIAAFARG